MSKQGVVSLAFLDVFLSVSEWHTPVWSPIGADVAKVDNMFLIKSLDERRESVSLNLADG